MAVYERDSGPHLGLTANYKDNTVSVVDLNQFTVLQTIPVGRGPRDLAVDSNLGLALVVNEKDDTVSVIDLGSFQVTRLIPVGNKPQASQHQFGDPSGRHSQYQRELYFHHQPDSIGRPRRSRWIKSRWTWP